MNKQFLSSFPSYPSVSMYYKRKPLGMALSGSASTLARLAPDRIPVKHGKKMENISAKFVLT